jgi:uncharacterized membrane protein YeaQ/YmgE (transglycosylase-associated protein family)
MTILSVLIIGGVVGWLAASLMGRDEGLLASILIGIAGSFIGSFISIFFVGSDQSYLAFNWVGVFWSFIGSIVLVAIMNALFSHSRSHHSGI